MEGDRYGKKKGVGPRRATHGINAARGHPSPQPANYEKIREGGKGVGITTKRVDGLKTRFGRRGISKTCHEEASKGRKKKVEEDRKNRAQWEEFRNERGITAQSTGR